MLFRSWQIATASASAAWCGVGADERFLEDDRIRPELLDQLRDPVVDRQETQLGALASRCVPATELHRLQAASSFADDAESARCRPWIDAENLHAETLGTTPDSPALSLGPDTQLSRWDPRIA